jgi:hypothetical protein
MWETVLRAAMDLSALSLASICLIQVWVSARDWRQFFLKKPYRPVPVWAGRLTHYLWWAVIPWAIDNVIHSARNLNRFISNLDHLRYGKVEVFAAGFMAFCCIIGLVSRYFGSDETVVSS